LTCTLTVTRCCVTSTGSMQAPPPRADEPARIYVTVTLCPTADPTRAGAGHDVPLAMLGTPQNPDYWRAADELGFRQLALLLTRLSNLPCRSDFVNSPIIAS
jgi:hypothetical protein